MGLRGMGLAAGVCAIVALVLAGTAQASWTIEGATLTGTETISSSATSSPAVTLETVLLGTEVVVTAEGLECSGECQLEAGNLASGTLKLTGAAVEAPSNCSIAGGSITTNPLKTEAIMSEGATFLSVVPASGTILAEFEISGESCVLSEVNVPLKGSLTGGFAETGVEAVSQSLVFSAANQAEGGGSLIVGKSTPATLSSEATMALTGKNAGKAFGVVE